MQKQDDNAQVLARLTALKAMTVKELKTEWAKLFGAAGRKVRKSVISDPRNPVIGTRLVRQIAPRHRGSSRQPA